MEDNSSQNTSPQRSSSLDLLISSSPISLTIFLSNYLSACDSDIGSGSGSYEMHSDLRSVEHWSCKLSPVDPGESIDADSEIGWVKWE